jgi:putative membrane protein insertion efficiency factor
LESSRKNTLVARLLLGAIVIYRMTFSAFAGRRCRYLPTCSDYSAEAISRFGAWRGSWLALSRVTRCHPWGGEGFDPVPDELPDVGWRVWRLGRWRLPK